MQFMNFFLRALCLLLYALAAVGTAFGLSDGLVYLLRLAVLVMLVVHALEVLLLIASLRRYPGPLALSIALTMLFGVLHWLPLKARPAH